MKTFTNPLLLNQTSYDIDIGMQHQELKVYKIHINDDPWLTLTFCTTMSNYVAYVYMFELGKLLQSH